MRKFILIALACLLGSAAYAQTVCPNAPTTCPAGAACLTWTPPTTNTDGSPIGTIKGYRIEYGTSATALTLSRSFNITAQSTCYVFLTGLSPATYFIAMRTVRSDDVTSDLSNVVSKTITNTPMPVAPNPPGTLTVGTAPAEVFQVIGTVDEFQFLPVGTVPANTQCISTQSINGRYGVPNAAVTWYGNVKPKIVVAQCN
jgi:hypothetical protein